MCCIAVVAKLIGVVVVSFLCGASLLKASYCIRVLAGDSLGAKVVTK